MPYEKPLHISTLNKTLTIGTNCDEQSLLHTEHTGEYNGNNIVMEMMPAVSCIIITIIMIIKTSSHSFSVWPSVFVSAFCNVFFGYGAHVLPGMMCSATMNPWILSLFLLFLVLIFLLLCPLRRQFFPHCLQYYDNTMPLIYPSWEGSLTAQMFITML